MFEGKQINHDEAKQAMEHIQKMVINNDVIRDCIKDITIQINTFKPLSDKSVADLNHVIDCLESAQIHLTKSIL